MEGLFEGSKFNLKRMFRKAGMQLIGSSPSTTIFRGLGRVRLLNPVFMKVQDR